MRKETGIGIETEIGIRIVGATEMMLAESRIRMATAMVSMPGEMMRVTVNHSVRSVPADIEKETVATGGSMVVMRDTEMPIVRDFAGDTRMAIVGEGNLCHIN